MTVGFVSRHGEALPFLREQMESHETITLEVPSVPSLHAMFCGHLHVDDCLMEMDSEFPQFVRLMCCMLKEFHGMGRRMIQLKLHPGMLIEIHELFAKGRLPLDVMYSVKPREICEVERQAVSYSASSANDAFPKDEANLKAIS